MKRVQSTSGNKNRYCIVIYNSDELSFEYVIDSFQTILGYETTQASNCAHLIHTKGEYVVKCYAEKDHAEAALDMFYDYGFRADILDKKQK